MLTWTLSYFWLIGSEVAEFIPNFKSTELFTICRFFRTFPDRKRKKILFMSPRLSYFSNANNFHSLVRNCHINQLKWYENSQKTQFDYKIIVSFCQRRDWNFMSDKRFEKTYFWSDNPIWNENWLNFTVLVVHCVCEGGRQTFKLRIQLRKAIRICITNIDRVVKGK